MGNEEKKEHGHGHKKDKDDGTMWTCTRCGIVSNTPTTDSEPSTQGCPTGAQGIQHKIASGNHCWCSPSAANNQCAYTGDNC